MKPYQHPLTEQALLDLGFYRIKYMSYPLYGYKQEETHTDLQLAYQNNEYVFSQDDQLAESERVYYRGPIASIDELTQLLKKFTGNGRAKTELGREVQDADFVTTRSVELSDGVLLIGGSMRWYKISKKNQKYEVKFDRDDSGFDQRTDVVGIYDSLSEAVRAAYSYK